MAQTVIGLDIGANSIKVTSLATSLFRFEFVDFSEHPLPSHVDLPWEQLVTSMLQVLFSERGVRADKIIASIPGRYVSSRLLQFPFSDRRKIAQAIPFELEGLIPMGLESILLDYQIIESGPQGASVLVMFTEKATLEKHLAMLREGGVDPQAVIPPPVALANLWKETSGGDAAPYAIVDIGENETSLCVLVNRSLRFGRSWASGSAALTKALATGLSTSASQAKEFKEKEANLLANRTPGRDSLQETVSVLLQKALGPVVGGIRQSLLSAQKAASLSVQRLYLCGRGSHLQGLGEYLALELQLEVNPLPLQGPVGTSLKEKNLEPTAAAVSLGLALHAIREAWASRLNLRTGPYTYVSEKAGLKREILSGGLMAAVLLAMLLTVFGLKYHARSLEYQRLTGRMEALAVELFPELSAVPPGKSRLPVMSQRLEQERREMELFAPVASEGLSVLDILREVSEAAPREVVLEVREIQIDESKVRIDGETDSYNSAEQIKANLLASKAFASADNPEYKPSLDQSRVKFVMTLQLSQKPL